MTYVNRDYFRHLTGLGRDYAGFVDHIVSTWEVDLTKPLPAGNLQVGIAKGEFFARYIPPENDGVACIEDASGHKASSQLMLSILLRTNETSEVISLPMFMILSDPDYFSGYVLYTHEFVGLGDNNIENAIYIGITKRGWRTRWAEHLRAAKSGSHYRFHNAIREWHGAAQVMSHHRIVACGLSERTAMDLEEDLIERDTLYPRGLNMVPGGNAGLAYLRKIGALGATERVAPDDRQTIINRFFERVSRKGLPNPLAAANWLNPNYAEQVICGGPDRLKPNQIRDARFFSSLGQDSADIAVRVGARNVAQIQRMLSGMTYGRVV